MKFIFFFLAFSISLCFFFLLCSPFLFRVHAWLVLSLAYAPNWVCVKDISHMESHIVNSVLKPMEMVLFCVLEMSQSFTRIEMNADKTTTEWNPCVCMCVIWRVREGRGQQMESIWIRTTIKFICILHHLYFNCDICSNEWERDFHGKYFIVVMNAPIHVKHRIEACEYVSNQLEPLFY